MTRFLNAVLYVRFLASLIISFSSTSVWAVFPDLKHPCTLPNTEYCFTPLVGWDDLARLDDPFLFCTEGDPDSNIVVFDFDAPPLPGTGARRPQPIAGYCDVVEPFFCGPSGQVGVVVPIKGRVKVSSIAFTKRKPGRMEETVKIYNPPLFTTWEWFCPCYDTLKLILWYAVCYDRGHNLLPGPWVNPRFRANQLPFPH